LTLTDWKKGSDSYLFQKEKGRRFQTQKKRGGKPNYALRKVQAIPIKGKKKEDARVSTRREGRRKRNPFRGEKGKKKNSSKPVQDLEKVGKKRKGKKEGRHHRSQKGRGV